MNIDDDDITTTTTTKNNNNNNSKLIIHSNNTSYSLSSQCFLAVEPTEKFGVCPEPRLKKTCHALPDINVALGNKNLTL